MASPVAELLRELATILGGAGVRWYLFGAQAAILHGAARLSADVDVTVDVPEGSLSTLLATLAGRGFPARILAALEAALDRSDLLPALEAVASARGSSDHQPE